MKIFFFNSIVYGLLFIVILSLTSCSYKPSSDFISKSFDNTVYVEVAVDRVEPENAPFIKDEINRLVYNRFKRRVVSKDMAKSQIYISYTGSSFTPLSYEDGYITRYRTNVNVHFDMLTKQGKFSKTIKAVHEADIHASSLDSSSFRTEAIRKGMQKALDEFMAYVSAKSASSK